MSRRFWIIAFILLLVKGCGTWDTLEGKKILMKVTAYCACQKCSGWKRTWYFQPVYDYGPDKGKSKVVGSTASGIMAEHGTVAADPKYYPFGTRILIKGYGMGSVQDVGGSIKGPKRLDLFFQNHDDALAWGVKRIEVVVFP